MPGSLIFETSCLGQGEPFGLSSTAPSDWAQELVLNPLAGSELPFYTIAGMAPLGSGYLA